MKPSVSASRRIEVFHQWDGDSENSLFFSPSLVRAEMGQSCDLNLPHVRTCAVEFSSPFIFKKGTTNKVFKVEFRNIFLARNTQINVRFLCCLTQEGYVKVALLCRIISVKLEKGMTTCSSDSRLESNQETPELHGAHRNHSTTRMPMSQTECIIEQL